MAHDGLRFIIEMGTGFGFIMEKGTEKDHTKKQVTLVPKDSLVIYYHYREAICRAMLFFLYCPIV